MNKTLWELRDEMRGQNRRIKFLDVLKEAKSRGIEFGYEDIRNIPIHEGSDAGLFIYPNYLIEFVKSYFKNKNVKSVLDCWAGSGILISEIVKEYKPELAIALYKTAAEYELAMIMQPGSQIDWRWGEPSQMLDQINTRFDTILGVPPFGYQPGGKSFHHLEKEGIQIRDNYTSLLLLRASLLLNDSGSAIFILPPSFLYRREEYRVISNLDKFGLGINAILHLPSGTFTPLTNTSGLLVVVQRLKEPKLFVGELTRETNQSNALLNNLKARIEGKSPQLGLLVKLESFRSFPALIIENEINSLSERLGYPSFRLSDICSMTLPKRNKEEEFVDYPNSVYLPTIGNSPAVASLEELNIKPQNYIQLVVKPEIAIAEYLAEFFNTTLGRKIRESWYSGGFIPKITKSSLTQASVFLPPRDVQIEILSTQAIITDISSTIDSLRRDLWNHPKKCKVIQKSLEKFQSKDDFVDWLESLPFPISSILWAYHADSDIKHKVEHLLFFFEALAEFLAILMLSAYASDEDFYMQESNAWIDGNSEHKDWVLAADFGGWRTLGERLAKTTRRFQSDEEKRELCLRLFGNPSKEFLDIIVDKKLYSILRDTNEYRNNWMGHTGPKSQELNKENLKLLESKVSDVRKIMQNRWEDTLIISPLSSEYINGIYEYKVKVIMGTRTLFKETIKKTLKPMDSQNLYILHDKQQQPVKLLPFIRLMESPRTQENAIYFYNRMKGDEVRWISYHFDKDYEIFGQDSSVSSAIKLLQSPDANS